MMIRARMMVLLGILALAGALHAQDAENMIGRQTRNEGFSAVPSRGKVVIDGKLDDWDLSGQIWSFADTSVRDSFSVKSAAMWDKDNLYLSFVRRDPKPLNSIVNPEFDPSRGWVADAVQLRVVAGKQPSWFTMWGFENGAKPAVHVYYWGSETRHQDGSDKLYYTGKPNQQALGDGIESAYAPAADFPVHRHADNMQPGKTSREFFWTARKAWGDLTTIAASVKEPRTYVEGSLKPQGAIPVRVQVPADAATFTIVIDDLNGNRVRNLAVADGVLILATDDNRLWLFDANTASLIKQTTLELTANTNESHSDHSNDGRYPFAFDGKAVYFFRQQELVKVGLTALKTEADPAAKAVAIPLKGAVEKLGALALDRAGNLYVTDLGKDLQVKKFAPDGRPVFGVAAEGVAAPLQFLVEVVEHDVRQQRRERPALRRAGVSGRHNAVLHHTRLQVAADEAEHSLVLHFAGHAGHQHVVVDAVEEFLQVHIHDPPAAFCHEGLCGKHGLMSTAAGAEAVAEFREAPLAPRLVS